MEFSQRRGTTKFDKVGIYAGFLYGGSYMEDFRKANYRLCLAMNKCNEVYYQIAKDTGIKENTLWLLYILGIDEKEYSQKQICEEWLMPKTTLNTVVRECVSDGYVTLSVQQSSKEKTISLTQKGKEFAEKILRPVYEIENDVMKKVCEEFSMDFILAYERYAQYFEEEYKKRNIAEQRSL